MAPGGPERARRPLVADERHQVGLRRARDRRRARHRPGRGVRYADLRDRRGRLPGTGPRVPRGVRGRRRLLRRQGVPVGHERALDRRGGTLPRRLFRRRAGGGAAGRVRPEPDRLPRQQQEPGRARSRGRGRRRPGHRRLAGRDRAARGDRVLERRTAAGSPARDRRGRGAHARVHRHRARRPEVRLLDRGRRCVPGDAADRGARLAGAGRAALAHRLADLRHLRVRGGGAAGPRPARPRPRGRHGPVRARHRRRLRHRLHDPGRPGDPATSSRRA